MSVIHEKIITPHLIYTEESITDVHLCCHSCTWSGKGTDAEQEYLFLTDATELYCPECTTYLGFVTHDESK